MIKQLPSILLMSYIALALGGCGLFQNSEEVPEETPISESPKDDKKKPEENFDGPKTASGAAQVATSDGLIPSTSPSERTKAIKPGRDNPFGIIPIQPVIQQIQPDSEPNSGANSNNGSSSNVQTSNTDVAAPKALCQIEEGENLGLPTVSEPILPIPNEARAVVVSGVMELNGSSVAIIKAPNENVSRQVAVGASVSNGQVRVKSINANSQKPYIVLEQYGVDINRAVGEAAEEPVEPPAPAPAPAPAPVNPDGYGDVRNLVLQQVELTDENKSNPLINGTLCNSGNDKIKVSNLTLQISEKGTNKIINSAYIKLPAPYILSPGTQATFDGRVGEDDEEQKSEKGIGGHSKEDITITLVDWS